MGNSEDGVGGGIANTSVGTIVWVRRRNGSWWPGRILGPEELSASHLMSPRSGTPVKLLGREDASVDWYNLEKSKRVKAFRCGEFDACIERAEASQGIPIKKREKYARREDAILHALELEKKQLEMKQHNSGFTTNKSLGSLKRDFNYVSASDIYSRNDETGIHSKFAVHKSQTFSEKLALLHEDVENSFHVHKGKNDKHIEWGEDITEAIHRMRGLQDFGLRIGSKKKLSQSVPWDPRKPADNNLDLPSSGQIIGGINHACRGRSTLEVRRKRSHGAPVEESLVKKRDRRRPLVQVLQSSAKLSVSHSSQPDHDPHAVSMQGEKEQMVACPSKRSKCIYLPTDMSESLGHDGNPSEEVLIPGNQIVTDNCMDLPGSLTEEYTSSVMIGRNELDSSGKEYFETVMEEETDLLQDAGQFSSKSCNPAAFEVSEKLRNMDTEDVPLSNYASQLHLYDHTADASAEVGVSMWHMKGKRNIRNLARRPTAIMDEKICVTNSDQCNESPRETTYGAKGCSFIRGATGLSSQRTVQKGFYHNKEVNYASGEVDLIDEEFGLGQTTEYGDRRYSSILKAARGHGRTRINFSDLENDSHVISVSGWEADAPPSYLSQRSYWKESDERYDSVYAAHIRKERRPMLVDVDLKVQASYQGEHVPLVSLMSRLNGKAIIGHPVQIEILEDGSTDQCFCDDYAGSDESIAPQPVWRTARRTAMQRVPRSNTVISALEGEDTGVLYPDQCPDRDRKTPLKSIYFNHQVRLAKKGILHVPHQSGKLQKPSKKVSLPSQKTKMLSSIGTKQKLGGDNGESKLARGSDIFGGLIKPEGAMPMVTCVPVKVAFSRILEAVGRPSSAAAHRARMISAAVRDPS